MIRLCSFVCLLSVLFSFEGLARGRWSPPANWPDSKDGKKDNSFIPPGCLQFKDNGWPLRVRIMVIPEVEFTKRQRHYLEIQDHKDAEAHIWLREMVKGTTDNHLFTECRTRHNGPCLDIKNGYFHFYKMREYFKTHKQSQLRKRWPALVLNLKCVASINGSPRESPRNYHWIRLSILIDPLDNFKPTLQVPSTAYLKWDIPVGDRITTICGEDKDIFLYVAGFVLCLGEKSKIAHCNSGEYFSTDPEKHFRRPEKESYVSCQYLYLKKPLLDKRYQNFRTYVKLIPGVNRNRTVTSPITIHVIEN